MKKLILLALTAVIMVGCDNVKATQDKATGLVTIDSCEYIKCPVYCGHIYIHHNNCKYCAERRMAELEELITKIKEEK